MFYCKSRFNLGTIAIDFVTVGSVCAFALFHLTPRKSPCNRMQIIDNDARSTVWDSQWSSSRDVRAFAMKKSLPLFQLFIATIHTMIIHNRVPSFLRGGNCSLPQLSDFFLSTMKECADGLEYEHDQHCYVSSDAPWTRTPWTQVSSSFIICVFLVEFTLKSYWPRILSTVL